MDVATCEGLAIDLYKRTGFDPGEPTSPIRIARTWLGADAIQRGHVIGSPATVGRFAGRWRILVRPTVPIRYLAFFVGHELGHVLLSEAHYDEPDEEEAANRIGGALMAPLHAMRRLYRAHGLDLAGLADAVGSTQTWAALRIGEAIGTPLAAVSPATVRVRGPESFVWPEAGEIRRLASGRARPGLAKVRITDDRGRMALVADDDA